MDNNLSHFLSTFTLITKKPHKYLSVQDDLAEQVKDLIKKVYDYTKELEESSDKKTLPHLIVEEFDEEQIWQELELQNGSCTDDIVGNVSHLSAKKDKLKFPLKLKCNTSKEVDVEIKKEEAEEDNDDNIQRLNEDEEDDLEGEDDMEDEDDLEDEEDEEGVSEKKDIIPKKKRLKPSIVDDKFFKLSELELFLQNEDRKEDKPDKEQDNFDLFDDTADQEVADYKYSDFFDNPDDEGVDQNDSESREDNDDLGESDDLGSYNENDDDEEEEKNSLDLTKSERKRKHSEDAEKNEKEKSEKRVRFSLLDSDDEIKSEEESESESKDLFGSSNKVGVKSNKIKSSFEERKERLGRVIEKLEEEALSEKPWQLKGEVSGTSRPQNSLLEEAVDFDLSVRPAPVISEEVTLRLEDIIMQRIKDKAWDDVERKVKPVDTPLEFKKKLVLDQEKSKLSLAEVYEQEFIKQREAATADDTERQEVEPALHTETRSLLHALFNKLDALSNYHFTPRPVAPELKVVSNVSAVVMEEVAPTTVADSALLAPQEIKGKKPRGELMSKEERTATDKKRARRLKKTKQRQRQREKAKAAKEISKMNPGLGNKYSKLKVQKDILNASSNISKMEESKEKVVKSSSAFFNKLQDEVKSHIKTKTTSFSKKKDKRNITAKKLKL